MGKDMVNHPPHYEGKVECIDALESATAGLEGIEAVDTANAIKYLWRWKKKNGKEDLKKAIWYIKHLLKTQGEPEDKILPQPQLSDICSMSPDAFMREYVKGKKGKEIIGKTFFMGDKPFNVATIEYSEYVKGTSMVYITFVHQSTERPDYFFQIKEKNVVGIALVEEVRM